MDEVGRALNRAWGLGFEAGTRWKDTGDLSLNPYSPDQDEYEAWEAGVDEGYEYEEGPDD